MENFATLLFMVCLLAMIYGLFGFIFRKGKRMRGLQILGGAFVCLVIIAINFSPPSSNRTKEKTANHAQETQKPALEPKLELAETVPVIDKAELDITQFRLANGMSEADAIKIYCDWEDTSYKITLAANEKFGEAPTDKKAQTKFDWENAQQLELENKLSQQLSLKGWETSAMSSDRYWQFHCRAREGGLQVITLPMAEATSDENAKAVMEGLQAYYLLQLNNNSSGFFDNDKFSVSSCSFRRIKRLPIVGCRLIALWLESKYDYFIVARTNNKRQLAAPWIGKGRTHIGDVAVLSAYELPEIYVSRFAYISDLTREKLDEVFGMSE